MICAAEAFCVLCCSLVSCFPELFPHYLEGIHLPLQVSCLRSYDLVRVLANVDGVSYWAHSENLFRSCSLVLFLFSSHTPPSLQQSLTSHRMHLPVPLLYHHSSTLCTACFWCSLSKNHIFARWFHAVFYSLRMNAVSVHACLYHILLRSTLLLCGTVFDSASKEYSHRTWKPALPLSLLPFAHCHACHL